MWTSLIQYADYVWLACRTDPDAPTHKGLSMLIVPTDAPTASPGRRCAPWSGRRRPARPTTRTCGCRRRTLVGEEQRRLGADHQPAQPRAGRADLGRADHDGAAPRCASGRSDTKLADGRRVIDQEWVQIHLARVHAKVEFLKLMNWQIASSAARLGPADASATKVFGTEFATEAYRLLMEVLGANAVVRPGSPGAVLHGRIERMHRSSLILTFGGGTNEVQRDIIAAVGLGLPSRGALSIGGFGMDFGLTEEQTELAGLTRRHPGRLTPARIAWPRPIPAFDRRSGVARRPACCRRRCRNGGGGGSDCSSSAAC